MERTSRALEVTEVFRLLLLTITEILLMRGGEGEPLRATGEVGEREELKEGGFNGAREKSVSEATESSEGRPARGLMAGT